MRIFRAEINELYNSKGVKLKAGSLRRLKKNTPHNHLLIRLIKEKKEYTNYQYYKQER